MSRHGFNDGDCWEVEDMITKERTDPGDCLNGIIERREGE